MSYDLLISYSRHDNEQGRITQLIESYQPDGRFRSEAQRDAAYLNLSANNPSCSLISQ